jgi:hypothetical protein
MFFSFICFTFSWLSTLKAIELVSPQTIHQNQSLHPFNPCSLTSALTVLWKVILTKSSLSFIVLNLIVIFLSLFLFSLSAWFIIANAFFFSKQSSLLASVILYFSDFYSFSMTFSAQSPSLPFTLLPDLYILEFSSVLTPSCFYTLSLSLCISGPHAC